MRWDKTPLASIITLWYNRYIVKRAKVAQLVEHSSEKAGVTGSIPVLGTMPHVRQAL